MKRSVLLLLLFLLAQVLHAQTRQISGKIIDQVTKEPLIGVNIQVKETNKGTTTDVNGHYVLNMPNGSKLLVISYLGYIGQEILINDQTVINVSLTADSKALGEVVVTALGITRQARTLTYATQQVKGDQLTQARDATGSVVNALSGKVAGLSVTQAASGPGGGNRVILRGNRSMTSNNSALFVIDGVAVDNGEALINAGKQLNTGFGGKSPSDGANNINPDDIESITVLKGASAAALYGSRASNGVIIITTKKGKAGQTAVSINSGLAVSDPMLLPSFQNIYGQGSGTLFNAGTELNWGPKMEGQSITDWTGKKTTLTAQPANIKDFFRNGLTVNNSVGISSGTDKTQSYISYSNNFLQGLIPQNDLMRHTLNARVNTQVTKRLNVEGKLTYTIQNLKNEPNTGETLGAVVSSLFQTPRDIATADMENYEHFDQGKRVQNFWVPGSAVLQNPYWAINRAYNRTEERNRLTAFGLARYDITNWLNAQFRISLDRYKDRTDEKSYQGNYWLTAAPNGRYGLGSNYVNERNIDVLISGKNTISKDLNLNYNIGGQLLDRNTEYLYTETTNLLNPEQFVITNTQSINPTYDYTKRQLQGVYGTAQVNYRNYLTLDFTARNDWSSTLPPQNQSYFYPSIGLTGIISDMVKLPSWISFAKIRGSYSQVGNDVPPYQYQQVFGPVTAGGLYGWLKVSDNKALNDLKPELTKSFEVGLDWSFLNDRIGIDLTLYHTNTINQFVALALPVASEFKSRNINAGNIRNEGFELILNTTPVKSDKFTWKSSLNFAANRNKVLSINPNLKSYTLTSDRMAVVQIDEGGGYGNLYVQSWVTDPATGKYVVDAKGLPVTTAGLTKNIGNFNPNWTLGYNNTFTYKKWSVGFLIDGRIGGVVMSGGDAIRTFDGSVESTLAYRDGGLVLPGIVQATGQANTTAITAEQFWSTVGGKTPKGEFYAYDATNFRLRELTLGYSFKTVSSVFKTARVSLVARNLFFIYRGSTLLNIPGMGKRKMDFDPDAANIGWGNVQGLEYMALPTPRSIGINLTLGF